MLKISRSMPRRLKWGIVGGSRFAEESFIPNLNLIPRAKINSIYSHDLNRAKLIANKFGIPFYTNDYNEFLKSDIEAVFISSANAYHYEQVINAAKAHKNILCEKPLAMSSQQAKEMIQVCNENNVFLTVDYLYRFHPLIIKAKELIDKQVIGKIVFIKIDFNINFLPGDNFRYNKNLSGGGALRDLGTHLIDLLRFFNDEMKVISGVLDNVIYKSEVEDFATALFKFENGGYGLITVSYCVSKSFNRIEIIGQKGSIAIDNIIRAKTNQTGKLIITKEGEVKFAFRRRANKLLRLLKSVNKSFLKNESPIISGNDGLINLQLIEEIEEQCKVKKI